MQQFVTLGKNTYHICISSASKRIKTSRSAVDPKLWTDTVTFGTLPIVTLSYLSHSAYLPIHADRCG